MLIRKENSRLLSYPAVPSFSLNTFALDYREAVTLRAIPELFKGIAIFRTLLQSTSKAPSLDSFDLHYTDPRQIRIVVNILIRSIRCHQRRHIRPLLPAQSFLLYRCHCCITSESHAASRILPVDRPVLHLVVLFKPLARAGGQAIAYVIDHRQRSSIHSIGLQSQGGTF